MPFTAGTGQTVGFQGRPVSPGSPGGHFPRGGLGGGHRGTGEARRHSRLAAPPDSQKARSFSGARGQSMRLAGWCATSWAVSGALICIAAWRALTPPNPWV